MTNLRSWHLRVRRHFVAVIVFAIVATQLSASTSAGSWPERTVRVMLPAAAGDRKSTRLNSSHITLSYAVFCLTKKIKTVGQKEFLAALGCNEAQGYLFSAP